jgi:hypothetical protein
MDWSKSAKNGQTILEIQGGDGHHFEFNDYTFLMLQVRSMSGFQLSQHI